MNRDDVIGEGLDLVSSLIKRRAPEVTGDLPSVEELEERFNEIYGSESPAKDVPETENAGNVSEKEKMGLPLASQSVSEGTACIPCSLDHLSTCSGLLAEGLRFARKDGVESPEVVSRIGLCRDELNAMERVDLRPELTVMLPQWQGKLANDALNGSRDLRHVMADIASVEHLENATAGAQRLRTHIGEGWIKGRIANMSLEEKAKVRERAEEILVNKEVEQ